VSAIKAIYRVNPCGALTNYAPPAQLGGAALSWQFEHQRPLANSTPYSLFLQAAGSGFELREELVTPVPATTTEPNIQAQGYSELSQTLTELGNSSQDDEWHIDIEVYNTSVQVAAALFDKNIPTPHVFSHGPKSVVFNWEDGRNNLYLTVGKSRLWAAVSSASEVKTRMELTAPAHNIAGDFMKGLQQSFSNRQLLSYDPPSDVG